MSYQLETVAIIFLPMGQDKFGIHRVSPVLLTLVDF